MCAAAEAGDAGDGVATEERLGRLLRDCLQLPRHLGEVAAFGGSDVGASVRSCFEKFSDSSGRIRLSQFLSWLRLEPQCLVWLPVMHRLACSEQSLHPGRCASCKATPMRGLRYKCLKCFNLSLCQQCFFTGRVTRHHKLTHPMQEYVRPPGSGDGLRSLSRALRCRLRLKPGGSGGGRRRQRRRQQRQQNGRRRRWS
uniref:ZZ-type domain-containing protein n=1 Tax=Macrostomum lignano TaxID=282301 RepID=A0A1I8IEY2_9PLAT